jgi:hypothetical protein
MHLRSVPIRSQVRSIRDAPRGAELPQAPTLTFQPGRSVVRPTDRGGRHVLVLANATVVAHGASLADGGLRLSATFELDSGAVKPMFVHAWTSAGWHGQKEPRVLYSADFTFGLPLPDDFPIPLGPRWPDAAPALVETTVDALRWPGSIVLVFSAPGFVDAVHTFRVPAPPPEEDVDDDPEMGWDEADGVADHESDDWDDDWTPDRAG